MIPVDPAYLPVSASRSARGAWRAPGRFVVPPSHGAPRNPISEPCAASAVRSDRRIIVAIPAKRGTSSASTMIRMVNQATRIAPFHTARAADFGDASVNLTDVVQTLGLVEEQFASLKAAGVTPLMVGGDHLLSLPALRAMAKDGPLGFVHFDSHTDPFDGYSGGQRYTHGTPFRRAVEEGLLDPPRMIQIGIRGTSYDGEDRAFATARGIRIVAMEEFRPRGMADVMAEAREILRSGPTYLSFDIDGIDPGLTPGTGTPEIGGFMTYEAQAMVRALDGVDIVAGDLVEVSPPFDPLGVTAWIGASILFEILSITAGAVARRKGRDVVVCENLPITGY